LGGIPEISVIVETSSDESNEMPDEGNRTRCNGWFTRIQPWEKEVRECEVESDANSGDCKHCTWGYTLHGNERWPERPVSENCGFISVKGLSLEVVKLLHM